MGIKEMGIYFAIISTTTSVVLGVTAIYYNSNTKIIDNSKEIAIANKNQEVIISDLRDIKNNQVVLFEQNRSIANEVKILKEGQKIQSKVLIKHIETTGKINNVMLETIKELVPWSLNIEKKKQLNKQLTMTQ